MSELSEKIDGLREMASAMGKRADEIGDGYGLARGMRDAADMLRDAADTIEDLRELGDTQAALDFSKQQARDLESCVKSMLLVAYWSEMTLDEFQEIYDIAAKCGVSVEMD